MKRASFSDMGELEKKNNDTAEIKLNLNRALFKHFNPSAYERAFVKFHILKNPKYLDKIIELMQWLGAS
jgi:hypothetical protein